MRFIIVLLLLGACAPEARLRRSATFAPSPPPVIPSIPTVVVTPGYVGEDVLAKIPPAPIVQRVIPMRLSGRSRTTFRFDAGGLVITAWNDDAEGQRLEVWWNGSRGCMAPAPPVHRARTLTHDEWRHLVWLVNIAEVERIRPPRRQPRRVATRDEWWRERDLLDDVARR